MKPKPINTSMKIPAGLELNQEGIRLVSITFGMTFYTNIIFSEIAQSILDCYAKFLQICPKGELRYFATANMRKHKPVTKRTLSMLGTWLKAETPPEDIDLELKNGEAYQDAPTWKFDVCAGENGSLHYKAKHANLVSISFPVEWGFDRTYEMLNYVYELCAIFPFQSGHAGFSFECSRYDKEKSQTFAWRKSMRFRGINIYRVPDDAKAVGQDALKTVGWLTILSEMFVEKLGGTDYFRRSLPAEVEFIEIPKGIILKAGPMPDFGDIQGDNNLHLYKKIYKLVAPLIEIAAERTMSFHLVDDFVERTDEWYRRLSDE